MTKPDVARPEPPHIAGERDQLTGFLDFQRATVVWKSTGLTEEQARQSVVPSELITVSGLVAHVSLNEEYWFGTVIDGRPDRWDEALKEDPDAEFRAGMRTPIGQVIADYEAQCAVSRQIVDRHDLDEVVRTPGGTEFSVRWVLLHMIEETARHNGHLDLVREMIDGLTGE